MKLIRVLDSCKNSIKSVAYAHGVMEITLRKGISAESVKDVLKTAKEYHVKVIIKC